MVTAKSTAELCDALTENKVWAVLCLITMGDTSNRLDDFHHSGIQFVNVELDTGLTFARIALGAKGANKIERNTHNARKAYDSALHALSSLVLDNEQAATIREKLSSLKSSLEKLGEKV